MEKGDIIRVSIVRRADMGPEHYGIFDGDRGVYHFQGSSPSEASIRWTTLSEFANGGKVRVCSFYDKKYSGSEIVNRAASKIGTDFGGYNLVTNNCEHFATWCATGVRQSMQIGHVNKEDDKRDLVEKRIDNTFNPLIQAGDKLDKRLGWGDYNEGEESIGEKVFEKVFINPIDRAIRWLDKL